MARSQSPKKLRQSDTSANCDSPLAAFTSNSEFPTRLWWERVTKYHPEQLRYCSQLGAASAEPAKGPLATFALCRCGLKSLRAADKFASRWDDVEDIFSQAGTASGIAHHFAGLALERNGKVFAESRAWYPFEFEGRPFPSAHHAAQWLVGQCCSLANSRTGFAFPEEFQQLETAMENELLRVRLENSKRNEWDDEFERLNGPYISSEMGNKVLPPRVPQCPVRIEGMVIFVHGVAVAHSWTSDRLEDVLCFFATLVKHFPNWVAPGEFDKEHPVKKGLRWKRKYQELPEKLKSVVESRRGVGYRIPPA